MVSLNGHRCSFEGHQGEGESSFDGFQLREEPGCSDYTEPRRSGNGEVESVEVKTFGDCVVFIVDFTDAKVQVHLKCRMKSLSVRVRDGKMRFTFYQNDDWQMTRLDLSLKR